VLAFKKPHITRTYNLDTLQLTL